jgi:DNA repair exonuclease SbcCD ATPase subunit
VATSQAASNSSALADAEGRHAQEMRNLERELVRERATNAQHQKELAALKAESAQFAKVKEKAGALTDELARKLEELDALRGDLEKLC